MCGSHGAAAATGAADVMRVLAHEQRRFRDRQCQAATREHRQIDDVVAHVGNGTGVEVPRGKQLGKRTCLVFNALVYECDAEIFCAQLDNARSAAGNDRQFNPRFTQHLHAVTVEGIEGLDFLAAVGEVERAVG